MSATSAGPPVPPPPGPMSAPLPPAPPHEPVAWKLVGALVLIVAGVWVPLALALLLA